MENQALIAALEQARSALDSVEAAATQSRRDKLAQPKPVAEEAATCPECGKAMADCACEDDAAEME
jgi:hypothetical protein